MIKFLGCDDCRQQLYSRDRWFRTIYLWLGLYSVLSWGKVTFAKNVFHFCKVWLIPFAVSSRLSPVMSRASGVLWFSFYESEKMIMRLRFGLSVNATFLLYICFSKLTWWVNPSTWIFGRGIRPFCAVHLITGSLLMVFRSLSCPNSMAAWGGWLWPVRVLQPDIWSDHLVYFCMTVRRLGIINFWRNEHIDYLFGRKQCTNLQSVRFGGGETFWRFLGWTNVFFLSSYITGSLD